MSSSYPTGPTGSDEPVVTPPMYPTGPAEPLPPVPTQLPAKPSLWQRFLDWLHRVFH